jgi:hypothetical protein
MLQEVKEKLRQQEQRERHLYQNMIKTLGEGEPVGKPTVEVLAVSKQPDTQSCDFNQSRDNNSTAPDTRAPESAPEAAAVKPVAEVKKPLLKRLFSWW